MLRAVIQASTDVASIAGPSWIAVALALHALAIATATLAISGATTSAVSTTPTILASANAAETFSMSGAVVGAGLLRTIVTLVPFVTLAGHLRINWNALPISRAR